MKVGFSMVFIGGAESAPPPGPNVKSEYPGPDRVNSVSVPPADQTIYKGGLKLYNEEIKYYNFFLRC